jgi:hypothetical protein
VTVSSLRALPALLLAALLATLLTGSPASAATPVEDGLRLTGADISWPNCPKGMGIPSRRSPGNPMPLASASFVVIGLTNGPGFVANPCLADHVAWAKERGMWTTAYSMTTFPTRRLLDAHGWAGPWSPDTRARRLKNAGYVQAQFNVASMAAAGLDVPFVWVDVEPYPTHPWSRSRLANRQVIRGVVRAYEDAGYRVGFYSYTNGWRAVVGDWRKPAYPTWVPVGPERYGKRVASAACRWRSFSGGPIWLAQWVDGNRDRNVTCGPLHGRAASAHPLTELLGGTYARGDAGERIRTLQRGMNMRKRYRTARFDARTERVLLAFQRIRSYPLTGVATDLELSGLGAGTLRQGKPSRLAEVFTPYPSGG